MEVNFSLNSETEMYKETIISLYKIALEQVEVSNYISVNVVLISPEEIQQMNKEYRNVDSVTDVLSFPMLESIEDLENEKDYELGEVNIGDIYINLERAKEQAKEYGHSLKREFCFLALHGFLHLLGYDHIIKEDEEEMFALQNKIMELGELKRE